MEVVDSRGGGGSDGRSKKGNPKRNSVGKCGHSNRSFSVRDERCEIQEKWTIMFIYGGVNVCLSVKGTN